MTTLEKILVFGIMASLIVSVFQGYDINYVSNYLKEGRVLENTKAYILLNDISWGKLPITYKEKIARQHGPTKLEKEEIKQLMEFYTKLFLTYPKDNKAISIAGHFDKEGKLEREKEAKE